MIGDVVPVGIGTLDEVEFPFPWPVLDHLFARDGVGDEVVFLEPDERFDAVASGEAGCQVALVLIEAARQIGGDAGVERAVPLRCEDVDVALHASILVVSAEGSKRKLR